MKIDLRTFHLKESTALRRARKGLQFVRLKRGNEVDHVIVIDGN